MRTIDIHNHFYPMPYIDALRQEEGNVKVKDDDDGNPVLYSPGDYNIAVPGHRDIDYREKVLDEAGVDMQVLTLTSPGTISSPPELSAHYSRIVNDSFAEMVREKPDRFSALGTLPLNDPEASVGELERLVVELGLKGVALFSNVNGVALSDECYWPLYEKAEELEAVFFIHPIHPVGVEAMTDYWLMPLIGFTFDTTLAAAKLVFSGVADRFPSIKWILAHLGGAIPYLAERLDRGFYSYKDCRVNIDKPPSEYLKKFYYDTVNFDVKALQFAIDFAGVDHLLAGSDYPHQIGSLQKMKESINQLGISEEQKAGIMGENVAGLLGL